jgi:hypothetical protein
MPRHGGLVSEGHRHSLDRPVSPYLTSKDFIRPMSHNSLTERGSRAYRAWPLAGGRLGRGVR